MRPNRTAVIIGVVLVVGIGWIIYSFMSFPPRYNWQERYRSNSDEPYDLSLFHRTVKTYFSEADFVELNGWTSDTSYMEETSSNMIFVGMEVPVNYLEVDRILRYVAKGNTVFVSTNNPWRILNPLFEGCPDSLRTLSRTIASNEVFLTTANEASIRVPLSYIVRKDSISYPWVWMDLPPCPNIEATPLGFIEEDGRSYENYVKISHGEGNVLVHTTPLAFANFHFRNEPAFEYAERVLSALPDGKVYYVLPNRGSSSPSSPLLSEGPLQLILSHPPLRWAWYGVIVLALIFVWNGTRRDRRTIPVVQLPENHTLLYLDVVTRMYQKEKNHKHIVALQYDLLKVFLRNRYRLNVDRGEEFYANAAFRLEMEEPYLRRFFTSLHAASHLSGMSDRQLIELDQKITEFYKSCP